MFAPIGATQTSKSGSFKMSTQYIETVSVSAQNNINVVFVPHKLHSQIDTVTQAYPLSVFSANATATNDIFAKGKNADECA